MGFAYGPDGALDDQDELEPINTRTNSICANTNSCPSPLYHLDGAFLGEPGTDNFGLDDYEPKFFLPLLDWIDQQEELDSSRIAVMGGSYGGYMVLASMTHFNQRLRCGIDIVGISNFVTFLKNTKS